MKSGEALIYWDRINNSVYTTKYTVIFLFLNILPYFSFNQIWTFLPQTLFNFFCREACLFYMVVSFIMVFWEEVNPFLSLFSNKNISF